MSASIFNGSAVKLLKDILRFKAGVEIITNDSDDPTVVAKSAPAGSIYIRNAAPYHIYRKQDSGLSTNWVRVASVSDFATYVEGPVSATDNAIARYDSTSGKLIKNSGVTIDNSNNVAGVNNLTAAGTLNVSGAATFGSTVTLSADAVASLEAVTKQQLDAAIGGVDVKKAVDLATTANITLSGEQTIDGVVTSSSRVLVKNQTDQTQNGIYVSSSGAWTRASDADTGSELDSALVSVRAGSTNANTGWYQTTDSPVIGTSNIVWEQFFGAGTYAADGQGIELTGSTFVLELDGPTLSKSTSGLKVASGGITNSEISTSANISLSKLAALTANRAIVSDASGVLSASSVTSTEVGYLSGVTSNIQTQLNGKIGVTFTSEGQLIVSNSSFDPVVLNLGSANSVLTSNGTTAIYKLLDNTNIDASAGIVYSKLSLTNSIVNADISSSAGIAYSKLSLSNSIVDADINSSAAISLTKLATVTADRALISNGSGYISASSVTATELGYLSGVTSAIQTQLDARRLLPQVNNSRASALSVTASTVITPTAGRDLIQFVAGSGGAVTVTAATPVEVSGMSVGQTVTIVGTSDTNTVTYQNGNNLRLNGNCTLGKDDSLTLMFIGTDGSNAAWSEIART